MLFWSLLRGLQQLVLHAQGLEKFLRETRWAALCFISERFYGSLLKASACSRCECSHIETRMVHVIIKFGVALDVVNSGIFYGIVG